MFDYVQPLYARGGIDQDETGRLQYSKVTKQGTSLADLAALGGKIKLAHRLVYRQPGQPLPTPAVMHLKVDHFATVLREQNGRFEVRDATAPTGTVWMTQAAVDAEATISQMAKGGKQKIRDTGLMGVSDVSSCPSR